MVRGDGKRMLGEKSRVRGEKGLFVPLCFPNWRRGRVAGRREQISFRKTEN